MNNDTHNFIHHQRTRHNSVIESTKDPLKFTGKHIYRYEINKLRWILDDRELRLPFLDENDELVLICVINNINDPQESDIEAIFQRRHLRIKIRSPYLGNHTRTYLYWETLSLQLPFFFFFLFFFSFYLWAHFSLFCTNFLFPI